MSTTPSAITKTKHNWFDSEFILRSVTPWIKSFRTLHLLSKGNHTLNRELTQERKDVWIDLAVEMLECPLKNFIPADLRLSLTAEWTAHAPDNKPFFDYLRSLVVPWTVSPDFLDVDGLLTHYPTKRFLFVVDDGQRLCLQRRETNYPQQSLFPSSAISDFTANVVTTDEVKVFDMEERYFGREFRKKFPNGLDEYRLTSTTPMHATIEKYPIHGGVFALLMIFKNHQGLMEGRRGVYFVSYLDHRVLTYIEMDTSASAGKNFIQSRPGQLWILTDQHLRHYHQKTVEVRDKDDSFRKVMVPSVQLSKKTQRMGMAMYFASIGDHKRALEHVFHWLGTDVNARVQFNGRTILHYAARNGQTEAVEKIIAAGGYRWVRDWYSESPMYLACLGLHEGCVEMLMHGIYDGSWNSSELTLCWSAFLGEKPQLTDELVSDEVSEAKYRHWSKVSVPRITAAFCAAMQESGTLEHLLVGILRRGLASPWILSSPEAMRIIFKHGEQYKLWESFMKEGSFRDFFKRYHSKTQETMALESIEMLMTDFGMDINFRGGVTQDPPLIWAVRHGTYQAVKTLIEKFKADPLIRAVDGNPILEVAMTRNSTLIPDRHAGAIVGFLSGIGRN
jgi:hypothetical protein